MRLRIFLKLVRRLTAKTIIASFLLVVTVTKPPLHLVQL